MANQKVNIGAKHHALIEQYNEVMGIKTLEEGVDNLLGFALNTLAFKGKIPLKAREVATENGEKEAEKMAKMALKAAKKGMDELNKYMATLSPKQEYRLKYRYQEFKKMAIEHDKEQEILDEIAAAAKAKIDNERLAKAAKKTLDKECIKGVEAFDLVWIPLSKDVKTILRPYLGEWKKDAKRSDKRLLANGFRPKHRRFEEVEIRLKARDEMEKKK